MSIFSVLCHPLLCSAALNRLAFNSTSVPVVLEAALGQAPVAFETISSQRVIACFLDSARRLFHVLQAAAVVGGGVSHPLQQHKLVYPKGTLLSQHWSPSAGDINAVLQTLANQVPDGSGIERHSAASRFSAKGLGHHAWLIWCHGSSVRLLGHILNPSSGFFFF